MKKLIALLVLGLTGCAPKVYILPVVRVKDSYCGNSSAVQDFKNRLNKSLAKSQNTFDKDELYYFVKLAEEVANEKLKGGK